MSKKVAATIKEKKIIFWFQDSAEWGPRALGNRSILADPSVIDIREVINSKIKKRELFRPYAASILPDHVDEYFFMHGVKSSPYMNSVFDAKDKAKISFPGLVHIDGTVRIQTVGKENNEKFHNLINNFKNITGTPLLINTSLNINEPTILNPIRAFDFFLESQVECIVINNWIIEKLQ